MDHDPDMEMEDMREDIPGHLGYNRGKGNISRRRTSSGFKPQGSSVVFWGIGVLVLIAVFTLFFIGGDKASTEELNSIRAELAQLDKKLVRLEGPGQKMAGLEDRIKGLQKSVEKLDGSGRTMRERLDKLEKKIDGMQKRSISQTKRPYHEVRRGETLYRIAKKYGISVDELRRLNNLNQGRDIYPGQKLLVTQGNSQ